MQLQKYLFLGILFCALYSCSKKSGSAEEKPTITDYYAVGTKVIGGEQYGIVWKNGAEQSLPTADKNSNIYSVFVNGEDVYYTGTTTKGAVYWKNNNPVYLSGDAFLYASVSDIAISGNDIYLVGTATPPGKNATPFLWKNGVVTYLPVDGTNVSSADKIVLSGNDVYISGIQFKSNGNNHTPEIATLWKNGVSIPLEGVSLTNNTPTSTRGLSVLGLDVYVSGTVGTAVGYWKNGKFTTLDPGTGPYGAIPGEVSFSKNNDMYIAGMVSYEAVFWKNGILNNLFLTPYSGPETYSNIGSVAVIDNDVYFGGLKGNNAAQWLNGNLTILPAANATKSYVNDVAVNRHQ